MARGENLPQEPTVKSVCGIGSCKVSITNLTYEQCIDHASPSQFKYCSSDRHIPEAILVMRKASRSPLEYLKYTFTGLIIAMVSPSGSQGGELASRESIQLSFSTVKQEYVVQNQQGGSGRTITAGYDFKADTEISRLFFRPHSHLAGTILLLLMQFSVNELGNPTWCLCSVLMHF
ncbi:type VI secretion system tube protein Hcp, partial [Leptospira borgpetersenii serovar Hardjo-bovis]|nr:type VI secretion system tube protein Hcp [Leptospira borgpetersenii serovar Hardjo-bovis]